MGSGRANDRNAGEPAGGEPFGLDLNAAFDQRGTLFTKAAECLADILAHPPTGLNGFDLLSGGIDELSNMMIRSLPLRSLREARMAQAVQLTQVLEDAKTLALGQAVSTFLDRLQAAADEAGIGDGASPRPIPDLDLIRLEQALRVASSALVDGDAADRRRLLGRMAGTPAQSIDGVLAKLRALRDLLDPAKPDSTEPGPPEPGPADPRPGAPGLFARLLSGAIDALERMVLARAVGQSVSAAEQLQATAPPQPSPTLPPGPWGSGWLSERRSPSRPRGFCEDSGPDPESDPAVVRVAIQRLPLGTVLDWQQEMIGLWRRHATFGPGLYHDLKAMGLLSRCVILSARNGGPLCFRHIGGPTRRVFGDRWADESIGKPHLEDIHPDYTQSIHAQYLEAIEGGEPIHNFLTITGLPRPPMNYRHLLFGWVLGDRRQVLLSLIDA